MSELKDRPLIFVKLIREGSSKGEPLDISDKILGFRYEDEERKADRCTVTIDNYDLEEFDNPNWKKGGILEVRWGYPGNMSEPRRVVIEKISGAQELEVEAHGLEMVMNKAKTVKVHKGKTLHQLVTELSAKYASIFQGYEDLGKVTKNAKEAGSFENWYAQVAAKNNFDRNPDNKRHFYDFRGLYQDMLAGKTPFGVPTANQLPPAYRIAAPGYWVRNSEGGALVDSRTGREVTDAEVEKIATAVRPSEATAEPNIDNAAKEIKLVHVSQSAQTDAQLISTYARKFGYVFYIDHKGLHLKQRDTVYKKGPTKVLTWFNGNGEWLDFRYENDANEKAGDSTAKGIDPLNKKTFEVNAGDDETKRNGLGVRGREYSARQGTFTAAARDGGSTGAASPGRSDEVDVGPTSITDPTLAKKKADGKLKKKRGHAHELTGTLVGDPKFEAKTILQVEGIGRRLSGKWAIKSVEHRIDDSGYTCTFKAERDGDNGYGEKGEHKSKASISKEEAKPADTGPVSGRKWDNRRGEWTKATRDPA